MLDITNRQLKENEVKWLTALLDDERITYRDQVIAQINGAKIDREYTKYYLFLKFDVSDQVDKICVSTRVSVEIRVHIPKETPILFLIHFMDGYVCKLEVFRADSSAIDSRFALEHYEKIEHVFD